MNTKVIRLMSAVSLLFAGAVQAQDEKPRYFSSADIFDLEWASEPSVSPDGKSVVYTRRSNDIMTDKARASIWLASVDGSGHQPLLSGRKDFSQPVWSPDGSKLAYLSNVEGSTQLYVRWMNTGQTALVTNLQKSPSHIEWAPDGRHIAFTMMVPDKSKPLKVSMPAKPKDAKWAPDVNYVTKARYQADGAGILEPAYRHVFVVSAEGGAARQLTSGAFNHGGPLSWSANSDAIFFSANRTDDWEYQTRESNIYRVSMNGEIAQITDLPGSETSPVVSPNGKLLAFLHTDNKPLAYRNRYLMVANEQGQDIRNITADIDNSVENIHWSENSKGLYYQMDVRGSVDLGYSSLSGKHQVLMQGLGGGSLGRPYTAASFDVDNNQIVFTNGGPNRPADLHSLTGKKSTQLTALNEDVLAYRTLGEVKEINYQSSIDGEAIQGWYILPPNFDPTKKYPLILEIHGGPHLSYGPHFSAELQRFAAEGYVVFYDNHRGSTSYGERFALLLQNKYSSEYDFADHMSGVDAMIELGFVDPEKLYIAGGSAGGIASAYAIGLTNRFKAAAVSKPVINWLSKVLTADSYLGQIPNQFPGMPWDHVEHYWQRSPLSLVGNVTTPTMLITGEADRRTPISETEQFYQALKLRKVDTIMVRVPGSPHGIASKPSRMIAKIENILAWFNKYQ